MKSLLLEEMSWTGIKTYLNKSKTILIPIGSIEQEGTHLPVGLDTHVALHVCKKVSEKTGCLVGPVIPIGYSEWFMEYPGTITLSLEMLTQLFRQYCSCLFKHGFRKFICINPHRGNSDAIGVVGREIKKKGALVSMLDVWRILNQMASKYPFNEKDFKHAGEIMTSVALAIYPELVDMESAVAEYASTDISKELKPKSTSAGPFDYKGMEIMMYFRCYELTKSGTMGNPTNAKRELGIEILDELNNYAASFVEEIEGIELEKQLQN